MACLSINIWPEGGVMSVTITPQRRRKINTRRLGGDRWRRRWKRRGCRVNEGNENAELRDKLYAPWSQDGIQEMKVTWSHIKDALTTRPINGIVGQEKTGPLEYAMKLSGSLKHHLTALDVKPNSCIYTSTWRNVCWIWCPHNIITKTQYELSDVKQMLSNL